MLEGLNPPGPAIVAGPEHVEILPDSRTADRQLARPSAPRYRQLAADRGREDLAAAQCRPGDLPSS